MQVSSFRIPALVLKGQRPAISPELAMNTPKVSTSVVKKEEDFLTLILGISQFDEAVLARKSSEEAFFHSDSSKAIIYVAFGR